LPFDGLGSFDLGDGVGIGGLVVKNVGSNLIYSYPGESWNGTEASQWVHYNQDGLFIAQFGTSGDYGGGFVGSRPGFSGNSFYSTLVGVGPNNTQSNNSDLYLYANDQTDHSGVIRWHIIGANSILEQSGTGSLGQSQSIALQETTMPNFPTGLSAVPGNGQVTLSWHGPSGSYTVKEATNSGGPYQNLTTSASSPYIVTGLTNNNEYFFVVSTSTSANSNQVQAFPFLTLGPAGQMTGGLPGAQLDNLRINSTAPSQGMPALMGLNALFGNLSLNSVGTKGYVIYNWAGGFTGTNTTPVPYNYVEKLVAPISNVIVNSIPNVSQWFNEPSGATSSFTVDGVPGATACLDLHDQTNGTIDIQVALGDQTTHY
jgi:hypothetical protein